MAASTSRERFNEKRRVQRALYRLEHPRSPRSVNKLKKNCVYCGKEFWIFPCLQRVECCSRKCAAQLKGAALEGPRLPSVRACPKCGTVGVIRDSRCASCINESSKVAQRRWRRIPEKVERMRAVGRRAHAKVQADPVRRVLRNLRQQEHEARRRALIQGTRTGRVSYVRVLTTHGTVCHICRGEIAAGELSFDHVIPLVRGGAHIEDNLRPAHTLCNIRKGAKLPEEIGLGVC